MASTEPIPRSRVLLYAVLAVAGCLIDLVTKHYVFASPQLFRGSEWWLWQGHIGIQKSLNEGALFGMGQGRAGFFAVFALVALVAIPVWLFWFGAARDRLLTVALGSVTGGIFGNLYDRLGWHGLKWSDFFPDAERGTVYAVRDWILLQWNSEWVWPNFNIADMLLVGGAILLMYQAYAMPEAAVASEQTGNH